MAEMSNSLDDLADVRKDLLLAEAAAWIHDMGKCDDRHIEKSASDGDRTIQYNYKTAHLSTVSNIQLNLLGESITLTKLIEQGEPGNFRNLGEPFLIRLLGLCHGVAHIEKAEIYFLAKQKAADTRLSTPFGHEFTPLKGLQKKFDSIHFNDIIANPVGFMREVKAVFGNTVGDTRRPFNDVSLWIWSHAVAAFYKAALASRVLGSQDDLSKLHWRLLSVRFDGLQFLESVDRIPDLLARQKILKDGLSKVRDLLEFEYPLGTEVYSDENGSIFIVPDRGDLLELQDKRSKTLHQRILEAFWSGTIPKKEHVELGGELVPDVQLHDPWPSKVEPIGEEPWKDDKYLYPPPPLSIDRQMLRIPTNRADIDKLRYWWAKDIHDRCSVCQLRPQGWRTTGTKALERKVCGICEERREDRSKEWAGDLKSTIWIDEVADTNGGVALIAGKFSLEHWLDGQMVFYPPKDGQKNFESALLDIKYVGERSVDFDRQGKHYAWVQSVIRSSSDIKERHIPDRFKTSSLQIDALPKQEIKVTDVKKSSSGNYCVTLDQILWGFVPNDFCCIRRGYFRVVGDGSQIETTDEASRKIVREQILQTDELLIEQAVKLYHMEEAQTPARLSRIWETTLRFWQDLQDKPPVGEVSPRLRIHMTLPETELRNKLARSHTYELRLHNVNLSVCMVADGEFITVDNLQRIAMLLDPPEAKKYRKDYRKAAGYVQDQLEELREADKPIEIEEPTGYGSANRPLGTLHIRVIELERTPYVPAIPILTGPRTFMVLVPADKALQVVEAIKKKYEDEIGKVRNRLPLTVGVVFARIRTPLPAILNAGRRMLQQQTKATEWWARKVDKSSSPKKIILELEQEEVQISLTVKAVMGDGVTEDIWYPYWCLAKERDILRPRKKVFTSTDGRNWVHISNLQEGDTVSVMPSRLDFEFLDTASRRFEVSYKGGKRRGTVHPARPYYLEQLDEIEELWTMLREGLATSQIDNLVGLIETKRMEWLADQQTRNDQGKKAIFEEAVRQIIRSAEWKAKPDKEKLVQAGVNGQLADVVELHMTILKEGGNDDNIS
jgi:CRISPR-associated Csx11 family protein